MFIYEILHSQLLDFKWLNYKGGLGTLSILVSIALPCNSDWSMSVLRWKKIRNLRKGNSKLLIPFWLSLCQLVSGLGWYRLHLVLLLYVPETWLLSLKRRFIELGNLILEARSFVCYYKFKNSQSFQLRIRNIQWTRKE